jgi:hypothetical protein
MKKYIILTSLLCLSLLLSAQIPQWEQWGYPVKHSEWKGDYDVSIFPKSDGGFYYVRSQYDIKVFQTRIEADEYDANLERIRTVTLTPPYGTLGYLSYVDFHQIGEKYYMFLDLFVKEEQKTFLYVQEVDMQTGKLLDSPKEIANMPALTAIRAGEYEITFSPDGSKMLVTQNESSIKKSNERISFRVFDTQFKELWFNTHRLPYPSKLGVRNSPMINDAGNIYFFKEAKAAKGPRFLTFFTVDANGFTMNESTPNLGVHAIGGYRTMFDADQNPILIGYYQPSGKAKLVQGLSQPYGVFMTRFDAGGNEVYQKLNEFSDITDVKKGINNCTLKEVVPYGGGYAVIGEWEEMPMTSLSGSSMNGQPLSYKSRELYIAFIDPTGAMKGFAEIKKNNESTNDRGRHNSYFAMAQGGQLFVFFNDFKHKYDGSRPGPQPRRAPIMQTYDSQGQLFQTMVFDAMGVGGPDDEFHLCTDEVHQLGERTFLVKGASRVEVKMGTLTIPD